MLAVVRNHTVWNYLNKETYSKTKMGFKNIVSDWFHGTKKVDPSNKAVLITGCDKGFGHALAYKLDSQGFCVFASCLYPTEAGALDLKKRCSNRLKVLPLDVRKDESVKDAVQYVQNKLGTRELHAVVNNAGVQRGLSLEFTNLDDYKESLEVNALGMVRVTKAFLPLLRQSKGRVVNLTSILGRIAVPHGSPYVMSKFAATGFNDSIRQELSVWGIKVICVEPELFSTQLTDSDTIGDHIYERMSSADENIITLYGTDYLKQFKRYSEMYMSYATPKLHLVLDALERAVTMEKPWPAYRPTRNFLTKFLIWDYELKMHISKDAITKFLFYVTNFPKPRAMKQDNDEAVSFISMKDRREEKMSNTLGTTLSKSTTMKQANDQIVSSFSMKAPIEKKMSNTLKTTKSEKSNFK